MHSRFERYRRLPKNFALRPLVGSAGVLGLELALACPLGFAPGWANGWPGVSKHTAFAAVFSAAAFVALIAAGIGVSAIASSLIQRFIERDFVGWGAFAALLMAWVGYAVFLSTRIYPGLRASIAAEWP